jgi:hypothetical protein
MTIIEHVIYFSISSTRLLYMFDYIQIFKRIHVWVRCTRASYLGRPGFEPQPEDWQL